MCFLVSTNTVGVLSSTPEENRLRERLIKSKTEEINITPKKSYASDPYEINTESTWSPYNPG